MRRLAAGDRADRARRVVAVPVVWPHHQDRVRGGVDPEPRPLRDCLEPVAVATALCYWEGDSMKTVLRLLTRAVLAGVGFVLIAATVYVGYVARLWKAAARGEVEVTRPAQDAPAAPAN